MRSGTLEIIANSMSSALLWRFWENSFNLFGSWISMFIIITPIYFIYIYMIPSNRKIYNIHAKNPRNYFLKIREICLSFYNECAYKTIKNSKKI